MIQLRRRKGERRVDNLLVLAVSGVRCPLIMRLVFSVWLMISLTQSGGRIFLPYLSFPFLFFPFPQQVCVRRVSSLLEKGAGLITEMHLALDKRQGVKLRTSTKTIKERQIHRKHQNPKLKQSSATNTCTKRLHLTAAATLTSTSNRRHRPRLLHPGFAIDSSKRVQVVHSSINTYIMTYMLLSRAKYMDILGEIPFFLFHLFTIIPNIDPKIIVTQT